MDTMKIGLSQQLTDGLQAAADQWNITPTAAAKRILKQALQEQGHLPPAPAHRTLRLATSLTRWIQHTAHHNGVSQSETLRRLLAEGLQANPTPGRKVNYPNPTPKRVTVRIPPDLNQHIQTQAHTWKQQWAPTATDLILTAYFNRRKAAKNKPRKATTTAVSSPLRTRANQEGQPSEHPRTIHPKAEKGKAGSPGTTRSTVAVMLMAAV